MKHKSDKNFRIGTFSIPEKILKELDEFNIKTMIPKSKLVTKLLEDFLIKEKEKGTF